MPQIQLDPSQRGPALRRDPAMEDERRSGLVVAHGQGVRWAVEPGSAGQVEGPLDGFNAALPTFVAHVCGGSLEEDIEEQAALAGLHLGDDQIRGGAVLVMGDAVLTDEADEGPFQILDDGADAFVRHARLLPGRIATNSFALRVHGKNASEAWTSQGRFRCRTTDATICRRWSGALRSSPRSRAGGPFLGSVSLPN